MRIDGGSSSTASGGSPAAGGGPRAARPRRRLGPNESGKSTLREFIATALYGFAPAQRELHPYVPPAAARRWLTARRRRGRAALDRARAPVGAEGRRAPRHHPRASSRNRPLPALAGIPRARLPRPALARPGRAAARRRGHVAVGRGPAPGRLGARVPAVGRRRAARARRAGRRALAPRPPRPARGAAAARPHLAAPRVEREAAAARRRLDEIDAELAGEREREERAPPHRRARWSPGCAGTPTSRRRWLPGATSSGSGPRRPPSSCATTISRATPPTPSTGAGPRRPTPSGRPPRRAARPTSCRRSPTCRPGCGRWPSARASCASWRRRSPAPPTCARPSAPPRRRSARGGPRSTGAPTRCSAGRSSRPTGWLSIPSAPPTCARPSPPPRYRPGARPPTSPVPPPSCRRCLPPPAPAGERSRPSAAVALAGVAALLARSAAPRRGGPSAAAAVGALDVAPSRLAMPDASLPADIDDLRAAASDADDAAAELHRLGTLVATRADRLAEALRAARPPVRHAGAAGRRRRADPRGRGAPRRRAAGTARSPTPSASRAPQWPRPAVAMHSS